MDGLGSFLLFAVFFYLMMHCGCGAHIVHGHKHRGVDDESSGGKFTDPVSGKEIEPNKGYGVMLKGGLYRFCSRKCLDQFDSQPSSFIHRGKEASYE